ncbi:MULTISPECIES: ABC transporter ATP-binding protein [Kitasatospora]|uniref:ABC transporter ATP-binding protein n=1 Tax=Kitasatospora TaxID=2063 RepID=UPI000CC13405|nr:ATP-binding cassette domain-containing protein [Kitasatospora sp. GP30]MDH6144040.1 ABC-2 type transport system ATP-binding protein [Kitasatospora sp. GP30]
MIEIHELTKRYGSIVAVDGLTFAARPGQVTGFLGPNGAGKTTTMRMLLGLNTPTSGTATVNGRRFRDFGTGLRHVGALLDANDVHKGRTANAHLAALARSNGLSRRRVQEVLETVGLGDAGKRRIGGFSLGMRQRLGIATALLGDPPVLLFDEPVNGLDPEGIRWARELFRRLAAEGRTVFVSSHLMSEMEHTADHLVVVGGGRLIADEPLATFAARATTGQVVVRAPAPEALARVLREAGGAAEITGLESITITGLTPAQVNELAFTHRVLVHEVTAHGGTLEDAFMELTANSVQYRAGSVASGGAGR